MLLTTQYLDEADRLADQIVVIDHGNGDRRGHLGRAQGARSAASGSRCALEDPADAERAVAALSEMCIERPTRRRPHRAARRCASTRGMIAEAVRRLDAAGVGIDDISLHRPTLDDVFISLTGHAAAVEPSNELPIPEEVGA